MIFDLLSLFILFFCIFLKLFLLDCFVITYYWFRFLFHYICLYLVLMPYSVIQDTNRGNEINNETFMAGPYFRTVWRIAL